MACEGCSKRADALFGRLGLAYRRTGPNKRATWVFENADVAVLVPGISVKHKTTRSTVLMLVARCLFGRSRAGEAPTPTELWRLKDLTAPEVKQFFRRGTMVQTVKTESCVEVRRGEWLRLVGPIEERLVADETLRQNSFVSSG